MDLFVVETPLQLLNAHEARDHHGPTNAHLQLLLSPAFPYKAFAPLIGEGWTSVRSFVIRAQADERDAGIPDDRLSRARFGQKLLRQIRRRARLERAVTSYGAVDRLFLGNYLIDYMRHIGHAVQHRTLIVLDDGTDTIRVNEERHRPDVSIATAPRRRLWGRAKSSFRQSFVEWDARPSSSLVFFSVYDLCVRPGDRLVRHQYRYLRSRTGAQSAEHAVFFLGQPLAADGYLSEDAYLKALKDACARLEGHPIVYVPHPRESDSVVARVAGATGLSIRRFDVPIEIVIAWRGIRPRAVASFFCSALENCSVLCGSALPVTAFRVATRDLLCCHDDVTRIYNHLRHGTRGLVEVVDLG